MYRYTEPTIRVTVASLHHHLIHMTTQHRDPIHTQDTPMLVTPSNFSSDSTLHSAAPRLVNRHVILPTSDSDLRYAMIINHRSRMGLMYPH